MGLCSVITGLWEILRKSAMRKRDLLLPAGVGLIISVILGGCVERQLTINTQPQGAVVTLNDEEIGESPVTVAFNWYGDYNVTIRKEGFETLKTHRKLKGPWYDAFGLDFLAGVLWPGRIVDSYEWTFELADRKEISREQLLGKAEELKGQLQGENE